MLRSFLNNATKLSDHIARIGKILSRTKAPVRNHVLVDFRRSKDRSEFSSWLVQRDGGGMTTADLYIPHVESSKTTDMRSNPVISVTDVSVPVSDTSNTIVFMGELHSYTVTKKRRFATSHQVLEDEGHATVAMPTTKPIECPGCDAMQLHVRLDENKYLFNVEPDNTHGLSDMYRTLISGRPYEWQTIVIPSDAFMRTTGAGLRRNQLPPDLSRIRSFGFTAVGDDGPFRMEIGWVRAINIKFYPDYADELALKRAQLEFFNPDDEVRNNPHIEEVLGGVPNLQVDSDAEEEENEGIREDAPR
jgi:Complex I intermediate-associated protein 30 (CIA30)